MTVTLLAAMMLTVPACQYAREHPSTARGAGIGALGGAVIGGLTKGSKGALYGAVIGGLAGGAVGAYLDHKDRSARETSRVYDYRPEQGMRLEIEAAKAAPTTLAAGEEVNLSVTYALMAPDETQQASVTETRTIVRGGEVIEELPTTVVRTPGTYTSTLPVTLPEDAAPGTYEVRIRVDVAGQSSERVASFTVA